MTKKTAAPDVLEPTEEGRSLFARSLRDDAAYARADAIDKALQHHKINGGMLTVAQLIENAKQLHTYITGETE